MIIFRFGDVYNIWHNSICAAASDANVCFRPNLATMEFGSTTPYPWDIIFVKVNQVTSFLGLMSVCDTNPFGLALQTCCHSTALRLLELLFRAIQWLRVFVCLYSYAGGLTHWVSVPTFNVSFCKRYWEILWSFITVTDSYKNSYSYWGQNVTINRELTQIL